MTVPGRQVNPYREENCRGCSGPLPGRRRVWCSTECERGIKKNREPLSCTNCGVLLTGRQTQWCSLSCKRMYRTERDLAAGVEAYVRTCRRCGLLKPLERDFYKTTKGTYRRICRACVMADNDERNQRPDAADRKRHQHLMGLYGITLLEYEALLVAQGGTCAVCDRPPMKMRLSVDHNHRTGLIRGLLCSYCNLRVIGRHIEASVLARASAYLDDPPAVKTLGERVVPNKRPTKRRRTKTRQTRQRSAA